MALGRWRTFWRHVFCKREMEQALDEEVRSYEELLAQQKIQEGGDPEAARRRAKMELGGVEQVKEQVREKRPGMWLDALMQDLRFGARGLRKNPGFTSIAVLTLALGIGVNTAIFSMVDSLLLRPLPVKDAKRLTIAAYQQEHGSMQTEFSIADYRDYRTQTTAAFSELMGYEIGIDGVSVNGKAGRALLAYVSDNFFSGLGLQPALGRLLLPGEGEKENSDPVIVLSYSYWKARFGGDPAIVGTKVSVNGHPFTVVGVAPEGFRGPYALLDLQAYLPFGMLGVEAGVPNFMTDRRVRNLIVLGQLREGVSVDQAQLAMNVEAQRLAREYPNEEKDTSIRIFREMHARPNPDPNNTISVVSALFLGLAGLVLLLACGNVANILLVRATVREREMAIRTALGAGRARLMRQLLTESVLLALLGSVAGVLLGCLGSSALGSIQLQIDLPIKLDFSFDWRIFSYAMGAAVFAGLVVGIVPALRASRGNLNAVLRSGGRGVVRHKHTLRSGLVVAQVAGSLMLLIIAGLFTRSLGEAKRSNLGFNPSHLVNLSVDPVQIAYTPAQGRAFYKNLLARVRALPGVESACTATSVPMGYLTNGGSLEIEGYQAPPGQPPPEANFNGVSTDYFKTLGIPMVRGRAFTDADDEKAPYVGIVNEAMAKAYWPNRDPIGQRLRITMDSKHSIEVVGIAKDSRFGGLTGTIGPYLYLASQQHFELTSLATLQVRTLAEPESMIPEIEKAVAGLAPELPVFDVKTMEEGLNTINGFLLFQLGAVLAAVLGVLGLVLAVVGVYGVISYATSQKTQEIGIRLALGARPAEILKQVLGQGMWIVSIGLVVGLAGAVAAARLVGDFVAVSATDPVTYVSVSILLTAVALTACYVPARRAMRVDPMVALRYE
jgi:predicted permease